MSKEYRKKAEEVQKESTCLLCGGIIMTSKVEKFRENFDVLIEAVKNGELDSNKQFCGDENEDNRTETPGETSS